jgi:hypothetical protein
MRFLIQLLKIMDRFNLDPHFKSDYEKVEKAILELLSPGETDAKPEMRQSPGNTGPNPRMRLIALVYFENNRRISTTNMDKIAAAHGHTSKHSGKKLKEKFHTFKDPVALQDAQDAYSQEGKKQIKLV